MPYPPKPSTNIHIDANTCSKEQRKAYSRITRGAGKGDAPRNIYSQAFRDNYDRIDWGLPATTKWFHRQGLIDGHGRFRENLGKVTRTVGLPKSTVSQTSPWIDIVNGTSPFNP